MATRNDATGLPPEEGPRQTEVSPVLEALLAVHSAPDIPWLADAAMTASQRGVGALYGFLYLETEAGGLRGEEPASRERVAAIARVSQLLGKDPTRLTIEPQSSLAVAEAMSESKLVVTGTLGSVLPFDSDDSRALKAQRKLGVGETWIAPIEANSETAGVLVLLMPENHRASAPLAELLGRHIAVALSNLREGDAARKRGDLDAVRWIHDERRFNDELALEVARSARHGRPLSVLLVRVEGYAALLRKHGRFLAERALRRVAATMEEAMRATDFLGAYGPDGFAAILVEADETAAENAKHRYAATLGRLDLSKVNLPGLALEFSYAVATMREGGSPPEELIAEAAERLDGPTGFEQVA